MVKITGDQRHITRLKGKFSPRKLALIDAKLYEAGQEVQIAAQISITAGAVSGANHKPSKPGTPPNNDTGVLANSIEVNSVGPGKVEVSANAPYAAIQEFGGTINHPGGTPYFVIDGKAIFVSNANADAVLGRNVARTKPHTIVLKERPYMRPALQAKRARISELIKEAINVAEG